MTTSPYYDIIIIGAGPAGLTAAYHAAKQKLNTIVFEQHQTPGILDHPCGCMVSSMPHHITFIPKKNGVYFKELDFVFPNELILAYPKLMEFLGPKNCSFHMKITKSFDEYPIFQINKNQLLLHLTKRAIAAGAQIQYKSRVSQLIHEEDHITGVITNQQKIYGKIVLCGEGLSRQLTNQAKLFTSTPKTHFFIITNYLSNLRLTEDELGQRSIFGNIYADTPKTSGIFHSIGTNKALLGLAFLLPQKRWPYQQSARYYLDQYIKRIAWMNTYHMQGTLVETKGCWMHIQKPATLVTNGFIGMGDSIAPLGHSSNAIAMLMGKEAAEIASYALQKNDVTTANLQEYNKWLTNKLFKGVEFEAKLIQTMMNYTDEELYKVCTCFHDVNLEPFFIGTYGQQLRATLSMMMRKNVMRNWRLIKQLFS